MAYTPRHARSVNYTGPIIVTTTAALVAAVPTVALAQTTSPDVSKPTTITHPLPTIDPTRDVPVVKLQVAKTQHHTAAVAAKRVTHQPHQSAYRSPESHPKPVKTPTTHLYGNLSQSQLAALWVRAGGNPAYAHIASAVAMAESSGRQYAHSGSSDFGYWQINGSWGRLATYDALGNAKSAIIISHDGHNWSPWTTYTSGAYLRYM